MTINQGYLKEFRFLGTFLYLFERTLTNTVSLIVQGLTVAPHNSFLQNGLRPVIAEASYAGLTCKNLELRSDFLRLQEKFFSKYQN